MDGTLILPFIKTYLDQDEPKFVAVQLEMLPSSPDLPCLPLPGQTVDSRGGMDGALVHHQHISHLEDG